MRKLSQREELFIILDDGQASWGPFENQQQIDEILAITHSWGTDRFHQGPAPETQEILQGGAVHVYRDPPQKPEELIHLLQMITREKKKHDKQSVTARDINLQVYK